MKSVEYQVEDYLKTKRKNRGWGFSLESKKIYSVIDKLILKKLQNLTIMDFLRLTFSGVLKG